MNNKCLHINLFGGPSVGKSLTAMELASAMKRDHLDAEYVSEIAKDLVFSKDFFTLGDQLLILARQHHTYYKMETQMDYTINDGAFILSLAYVQENEHLPLELFKELIVTMFKSYNTLNIFVERNLEYPYQESGRYQTLEEAIQLDEKIKHILIDNNIEFYSIKSDENIVKNIYNLVKEIK